MDGRSVRWTFLGLLAVAVGYAAVSSGGMLTVQWNVCLMLTGLLACFYFASTRVGNPFTSTDRWLFLPVLLFPAYLLLQITPLPLSLLHIFSPSRLTMVNTLAAIMPALSRAALSVVPSATFEHFLRVTAYTLIFLLVREIARQSLHRIWLVVAPICIIAGCEAMMGLIQYARFPLAYAHGTYGNKNYFAGLLEIALPFAVVYLLTQANSAALSVRSTARSKLSIGLLFLLAALLFAGIYASHSRGGVVACGGSVLFIAALAWRAGLRVPAKWRVRMCIALFLAMILFFSANRLINGYREFSAREQTTRAAGGLKPVPPSPALFFLVVRGPLWAGTLRLIRDYPLFGCGMGGFESAFLKYQTQNLAYAYAEADNDYLQLVAELGCFGALVAAAFALTLFRRAVTAFDGSEQKYRSMGLACAAALIAIFIHSLVDSNLYVPANAMALAWIAGICAALPIASATVPARRRILGSSFIKTFALTLSVVLLIFATAKAAYELKFKGNLHVESILCRFGLCDTQAVAADARRAQQSGGPALHLAIAGFEKALRRDISAPDRWCDLGEVFLESGQIEQARYCFSRALTFGPNIPPIRLRVANYHFNLHEDSKGLEYTAQLLRESSAYDDALFTAYVQMGVAAEHIFRYGLPDLRSAQTYLRHLMRAGDTSHVSATWAWIVSRGYADDELATEYIRYLLTKRVYESAAPAWALYAGHRQSGYLQTNWLYNGDFEYPPSGVDLDWKIEQAPGVEITQDRHVAFSGTYSLLLRFDGQKNLASSQVRQVVVVKPGKYRFRAQIRTQEIAADTGLGFRISDLDVPERLDVETKGISGTTGWTSVDLSLRVLEQTNLIDIRLVRQSPASSKPGSFGGMVWIDAVNLAPVDGPGVRK